MDEDLCPHLHCIFLPFLAPLAFTLLHGPSSHPDLTVPTESCSLLLLPQSLTNLNNLNAVSFGYGPLSCQLCPPTENPVSAWLPNIWGHLALILDPSWMKRNCYSHSKWAFLLFSVIGTITSSYPSLGLTTWMSSSP